MFWHFPNKDFLLLPLSRAREACKTNGFAVDSAPRGHWLAVNAASPGVEEPMLQFVVGGLHRHRAAPYTACDLLIVGIDVVCQGRQCSTTPSHETVHLAISKARSAGPASSVIKVLHLGKGLLSRLLKHWLRRRHCHAPLLSHLHIMVLHRWRPLQRIEDLMRLTCNHLPSLTSNWLHVLF